MGTHPIFESDFDCLTDWLFDWIEIMPKYYCDYCDTFLTHDSPSVRKTHNAGRKHKDNVRTFYQEWLDKQTQSLMDRSRPMTGIPVVGSQTVFNGQMPVMMGQMMNPNMVHVRQPFMGMGAMQMQPRMMMMQPGMRMMRPGFQPY